MSYLTEVYTVYTNLMSLLFTSPNEEEEGGRNYGKLPVLRTLIYCHRLVSGAGSSCSPTLSIWLPIWHSTTSKQSTVKSILSRCVLSSKDS